MTKDLYIKNDPSAAEQAQALISSNLHAALATLDPQSGHPNCTRVGLGSHGVAQPLIFVSQLSPHTKALLNDGRCSLLIGEVARGDPMINPRLTLRCHAKPILQDDARFERLRKDYLRRHPKAKIYIDLPDFLFFAFDVHKATLIAGFGKSHTIDPTYFLT